MTKDFNNNSRNRILTRLNYIETKNIYEAHSNFSLIFFTNHDLLNIIDSLIIAISKSYQI